VSNSGRLGKKPSAAAPRDGVDPARGSSASVSPSRAARPVHGARAARVSGAKAVP
jgi:hypothetical protein